MPLPDLTMPKQAYLRRRHFLGALAGVAISLETLAGFTALKHDVKPAAVVEYYTRIPSYGSLTQELQHPTTSKRIEELLDFQYVAYSGVVYREPDGSLKFYRVMTDNQERILQENAVVRGMLENAILHWDMDGAVRAFHHPYLRQRTEQVNQSYSFAARRIDELSADADDDFKKAKVMMRIWHDSWMVRSGAFLPNEPVTMEDYLRFYNSAKPQGAFVAQFQLLAPGEAPLFDKNHIRQLIIRPRSKGTVFVEDTDGERLLLPAKMPVSSVPDIIAQHASLVADLSEYGISAQNLYK